MSTSPEVNAGYVPTSDSVSEGSAAAAVAAYGAQLTSRRRSVERLLLLPLLLLLAVLVLVALEVRTRVARKPASWLHDAARTRVDEFVRQYPLHLYPLLAKAFEAAYLDRFVPSLLEAEPRVLELAIGEGTLSSRIFPTTSHVVGLDLSPYSLRHAAAMPHVRQAVVCDCMRPPVLPGSFDLLVANNFLHHVTDKRGTLKAWGPLARIALFNESTPYWASAWPKPFLQRALGRSDESKASAAQIGLTHLQSLEPLTSLDEIVTQNYRVHERETYFSERAFFVSALFSALMRCSGPPTPERLKRLFLGSLAPIALPMTRAIAKRLIAYDRLQRRDRDAYVSYFAESLSWRRHDRPNSLACPDCGDAIVDNAQCARCGREYPRIDGMLFLLPIRFHQIAGDYNPVVAETTLAEHL